MYRIKLCNTVIVLQITFFLLSLYLFSLLLSFLLVFLNNNPFNHKTHNNTALMDNIYVTYSLLSLLAISQEHLPHLKLSLTQYNIQLASSGMANSNTSNNSIIVWRSANYQPSIWDYDYIQSLRNKYVVSICYCFQLLYRFTSSFDYILLGN